ncbi:methionyl-tRNA formyltransferase, partial [Candidatus Gottesmanbacteria bacterium]|nr:methionyl-tRNA formyltransferase [Candidatus Gottesmanbacteria bacterium]
MLKPKFLKTIFFGTPEFVIPVAQSLLQAEYCKLCAIVTNPDRPVGREQILTPSPIKSWALKHDIRVIDSGLKKLAPDLGILAAYGKIIPQELINLFPKGILVIHPSLLPAYRGASPVQAAILAGDRETGVTIIKMDEKMDHGPIISQFKEKILPDETTKTLRERLFKK